MTSLKLKYINAYRDRHGNLYHYFRRPGRQGVRLPGLPGSAEFMAAYAQALKDWESAPTPTEKPTAQRGADGTFDRLLGLYFQSSEFLAMKQRTRRAMRLRLERLVTIEGIGHRSVAGMTRAHVKTLMAKRVNTPGAANSDLKGLRALLRLALDLGWRTDDPSLHLKKYKGGEHHTWTDEEIAQFEAHWPIGTLQRTAFSLLLYTGQRRADVVRMTWPQIDSGRLRLVQQKTGTTVSLPLHPALTEALAAYPRRHVIILVTAYGKPYTDSGFGNKMADAIDAAGLPTRCVTHGLRKAAARRLAEAGCTPHEISAVTGHKSLSEVQRYTKAADAERLADSAFERLTGSSKAGKEL